MLTTKETADRLGIKPRSVVWLIVNKRLRATKLGRDYLIDESEVERYLVERRPQYRPSKAKG